MLITIVIGASGAVAPDGSTVLHQGDEIIAVIPREAVHTLRAMVTGAVPDDGRP